ncbi:uncharacterized protein BJ171DRAFT_612416 [Polychytrium aggregatum]|uniref:uncharacterized protein n=1 Tax=Polychytrium aggregatum TaxID=110093 RepID=UPI0022FE0874|nr:uncharacterized protein BJ171DRAFT_612416 [Polychytrium aggregatum]KAI9205996.1 hypothetical protein BJ171DRAFT_612416 [Polychytrium aggregatum]
MHTTIDLHIVLADGVVVHPTPNVNDMIKSVVLGYDPLSIPRMLMKIESEPVIYEPHRDQRDGKLWYFCDGLWKKAPHKEAFVALLTDPKGGFQRFARLLLEQYRRRLGTLAHAPDACKATSKSIESVHALAGHCVTWLKGCMHDTDVADWFDKHHERASTVALFKNKATLDLTNLVSRYPKPSDGFCVTLPYDFSHDLVLSSRTDLDVMEFLSTIMNNDTETVEYLLDFLSLCINFIDKPDKFVLFIAGHEKTSGKHLLLRLIKNALGDMAMSFPGELLRHTKQTGSEDVTPLFNGIAKSHAALAIGVGFKSKWTIGEGTLLKLATCDRICRREPLRPIVEMRMEKYKTIVSVDGDGPLTIDVTGDMVTAYRRVAVIHLDRVVVPEMQVAEPGTNQIYLPDDIGESVDSSDWGMALLGMLIRRLRVITKTPRAFSTDAGCCAMGVQRATMKLLPQYNPPFPGTWGHLHEVAKSVRVPKTQPKSKPKTTKRK